MGYPNVRTPQYAPQLEHLSLDTGERSKSPACRNCSLRLFLCDVAVRVQFCVRFVQFWMKIPPTYDGTSEFNFLCDLKAVCIVWPCHVLVTWRWSGSGGKANFAVAASTFTFEPGFPPSSNFCPAFNFGAIIELATETRPSLHRDQNEPFRCF